ncbi:MAG TPA: hypothetical protein VNX68_14140 [Nitrosopumilaceae archaeon]|jgi:hypothetical protein|nr:hypothetical protein [Nitrosopumilaceae archaeon]
MSIRQRIQILASLGIIYHFTDIRNALNILKQGRLKLTSNVGTKSDQGTKPYFFSMTRSKLGSYQSGSVQGAMLVIDPDYLKGKLGPVDYWGREFRKIEPGKNEMEERLWSDKQFVPIPKQANKLIKAIHVLQQLKGAWGKDFDFITRRLWIAAKQQNIPFYFYNNAKDWQLQRKDKAITFEQARSQLTGPEKLPSGIPRTNWLKPYLELYYAKDKTKLSSRAKRILQNAQSGFYQHDAINSLTADIHNMKTDERVSKLADLITKHGGVKPFIEYIGNKFQ